MKPTAPVEMPVTKEPWQMTKVEYAEYVKTLPRRTDAAGFPIRPLTHEQQINIAAGQGKPVPPEVLAEYPDLAVKVPAASVEMPVAKEPWQMTSDEHFLAGKERVWADSKPQATTRDIEESWARQEPFFRQEHRKAVAGAIYEGKPVPANVLADYPDLAAKVPAAPVESPSALAKPASEREEKRSQKNLWTPTALARVSKVVQRRYGPPSLEKGWVKNRKHG